MAAPFHLRRKVHVVKRLIVAALASVALALGACGQTGGPNVEESVVEETGLTAKALNDYTWDELHEISWMMSTAESYDAAREIARQYGIVEEDNTLTTQTKQLFLGENRVIDVRVAGIVHDDFADRGGKVGLTFMTVGALAIRPMNDVSTVEGGWEASSLRAWLDTEGIAMFEEDLRDIIPYVNKYTNNIGRTADVASVTATRDRLFVPSAHEICGDINWDAEEFRYLRGYENIDSVLNAEGSQYECFRQAGVTYNSDPNGILSLANSTGTSPWWYRSAYPFEFFGKGETGITGYFYQVRESGYPESEGYPEKPASVVIGFCI